MKKLLTVGILTAAALLLAAADVSAQQWYRGNLHMHSFWSDGRVFPEEAVSLYRDEGYNFVCLSDHNQAQTNKDRWVEIGDRLSPKNFERFKKRFPDYPVEMKTEYDATVKIDRATALLDALIAEATEELTKSGESTVELYALDNLVQKSRGAFAERLKESARHDYVRLLTYPEFKARTEVPGRFLVIPGFEPSASAKDGRAVHMNFINTETFWKYQQRETAQETLDANMAEAQKLAAGRENETAYILNHPDWVYFDVEPAWIVDRPFRFFEVINCGPVYPAPEASWTTDKFWDVVNAFRAEKGLDLLYGVASDDTHDYNPFYTKEGTASGIGGGGWIVVRAAELKTEAILGAMHQGDFYASTGVELADVKFDAAARTLTVKVAPKEGVNYRIDFIGTKKGFDKATTTVEDPAKDKKPARTFTVYSDDIGKVFQSVEGTEGSYTMADDDLYVRAKITADCAPARKIGGKPDHPTAWTQPVK